jgi:predicted permease
MVREIDRAFRRLMRVPRFAALCILPLALAFGGIGGLGGILNGLWVRSVDVFEPSRLVAISAVDDRGQQGFISMAGLRALSDAQDVLESLAGYGGNGASASLLELDGRLVRTSREVVTAEYFRVLGIKPLVGRFFSDDDREPVAVISHRFWAQQFASDPGVVGRVVGVDGVPVSIIGVTPPGDFAMQVQYAPAILLPLQLTPRLTGVPSAARSYYVVGRLKADVTLAAAQRRLESLWPHVLLASRAGATDRTTASMQRLVRIRVHSARHGISPLRNQYVRPLFLLLALGVVVLVVACVNVGSLLCARTIHREGTLGIELALGATTAGIVRGIIAEGLLVSLAAIVGSVPLAFWSATALRDILWTGTLPLTMTLTPDPSVFVVMVVAGVLGGLTASLPAILVWMRRRRGDIRNGGRTIVVGRSTVARLLAIVQLALSFVLVFVGASLWKDLAQLKSRDPGYITDEIYFARVAPHPGLQPPPDPNSYFRDVLRRLSTLKGVESVALSHRFPMISATGIPVTPVRAVGTASTRSDLMAFVDFVSPDFFAATGIRLLDGRTFSWSEDLRAPAVAIVNRAFARRLFADEKAALKGQIQVGRGPAGLAVQIIGIARDASPGDVRIVDLPIVYRPILQEPSFLVNPVVCLRGPGTGLLDRDVRATIEGFGRHYMGAYTAVRQEIAQSMAMERLLFLLASFVSGLAVLVASMGLYALLAYAIECRFRELALRMALGASSSIVRQLVIREGGLLVLAGLTLGIPLTLNLGRAAGHLSSAFSRFQPDAWLVALTVVLVSTALAVMVPAFRAGRINPVMALRSE